MTENKRSPWLYVGCGCLIVVGLLVVAVAGAGFFGVRKAQEFAEEMKDPEARAEKAMALLGASSLPEGFIAQIGVSIPFLMETAILSDGEAIHDIENFNSTDDAFVSDPNVFYYLSFRDVSDDKAEFERYLNGESKHTDALNHINIGFRFEEDLARGAFTIGDQSLQYLAQRGTRMRDRRDEESVMSLMGIDCPDDERLRIAVWIQRLAEPIGEGADPSALVGTPADEEALRDFMGHFAVCGDR